MLKLVVILLVIGIASMGGTLWIAFLPLLVIPFIPKQQDKKLSYYKKELSKVDLDNTKRIKFLLKKIEEHN